VPDEAFMKNVKTYSMFWILKWYFLQNKSCDFFIIPTFFFHQNAHHRVDDIATWWLMMSILQ